MNGYVIPATSRLVTGEIAVSVSSSSKRSNQLHRQATPDTVDFRVQGLGFRV